MAIRKAAGAALLMGAALVMMLSTPAVAADCATLDSELGFPHCVEASGNFSFAWTTDDKYIWIALDLTTDDTTAWMGVGPSEGGGMKGSDLWIVTRTDTGALAVYDHWSTQFARPTLDAQQDVVLAAPLAEGQEADLETPAEIAAKVTEVPGRLRALLRRELHACDARDLSITVGLPQPFVWAHGAGWPSYHGSATRGTFTINFVPPEGEAPILEKPDGPLPADTYTIDLAMPNVTIPTTPTSYLCTYFQFASDRKYQIIANEPIVNTPKLHHVLLFSCAPGLGPFDTTKVFDCTTPPFECSTFVIAWAPGIKYTEYPAEAGFPFGTSETDSSLTSWFVMQVHYNNPAGEVVTTPDASGLRLTYTSALRPQDLGVITLGQFALDIPGQKSRFVVPASVCPSECTERFEEPITMVYSFLHMHEVGLSMVTRHLRGDTELAPVARKRFYDFNFQGMTPVPKDTATLEPGDVLVSQCVYRSIGRDNSTTFGEGTMDEMCFNFITAYPRSAIIKAAYCWNMPYQVGAPNPRMSYCGTADRGFTGGDIGLLPFEEQYGRLVSEGLIINSTLPSYFSKYSDPVCVDSSPVVTLGRK